MLSSLKAELKSLANPKQAEILQRFFKTGPGEYGEGDIFLGIKVPVQRGVAKKYVGLGLPKIQELLKSEIHEERLVGLLILVDKFKKSDETIRGDIFNFYLKNTKYINNWDLVDLTAPNIVGEFLVDKKRLPLYELAESKNLWEKRISMIACFSFIRKEDFKDALRIAEILLNDSHDLIHKAVGWMLREIGKKDQDVEEKFLKKHYKNMPRTMLRYSIERFEEGKRQKYLKGYIMKVEIKKSKIHGKGVFAKKGFKKGEIVLRWNPIKLSPEESKNLTEKQKKDTISRNGEYYFMQPPEKYVNHSCEPNTLMNTDNFYDIALIDIKKRDEITSHYPNPPGKEEVCNCKSKKCGGVL